ncbi:MAG TPA: PilZ domain-containing protein [Desulfobacterales bacterium]
MTDPEKLAKDPAISVLTARLFELILEMPVIERQNLLIELEERRREGKRNSPREKCFQNVDFAANDRVFRGFIIDISADGMRIDSNEKLSVGQEIMLTFELPQSSENVKIRGTIVRLLPDGGFGVKFEKPLEQLPSR